MKFIDWLQEQINSVTPEDMEKFQLKGEEEAEQEEGTIIRELTDEEKKLFVVGAKLSEELENLQNEHQKKHMEPGYDGSECKEFHKKLDEKEERIQLVAGIMWKSIEIAEKSFDNLGIRKGWQLVSIN
jgi:hypothetical protein